MKDLKSQITKIKDSINCKSTNKDFNNISNLITKSKEKVLKPQNIIKSKIFNFLQKSPAHRNIPVLGIIKKKWVIILSSKPLTDGEQSLLQKDPKFAVNSPKVPLTEYIAVTKRICDELGEEYHREGLYRNLPENQRDSATLQNQDGTHSQHHQRRAGGHQNPLVGCLSCDPHSRQGGSPSGHGQEPIYW